MEINKLEYIIAHLDTPNKQKSPEFKKWLIQADNQQLFNEIRTYREAFLRKEQEGSIDLASEYVRFKHHTKSNFIRKYSQIAVAACIIIGLFTAITYRQISEKEDEVIITGRRTAELVLGNGQCIELQAQKQNISEGNLHIADNSSQCQLNYRRGETLRDSEEQVWHTLKIPAGADYQVKLSDGTKIWLNCDSELKYPVNFRNNIREIHLTGEAYFEVQKATEWPFIVHTDGMNIRVTGTKFNVYAYKSENIVHTTLIEGVVDVNNKRIHPSQQFSLDKTTGQISVKTVDTDLLTGWTEGMFVFKSERLEDVMNKLVKWYNVTVIYQNSAAKDMLFSGNLGRYDSIDDVLNIIRKLEKVNIHRTNRDIIISIR